MSPDEELTFLLYAGDVALAAGLQWLLRTEQPEHGALCQPNGGDRPRPGKPVLQLRPQGGGGGTTIVCARVTKVEHGGPCR